MTIIRLAVLLASFGLALSAANISTIVTPGGWAICDNLPYLCFGNIDRGAEEWIVVITSDSTADAIAFNLDVTCADGVTRSFLIRRSTETPWRTMAFIKLGRVAIRSTTTTVLHIGQSFTATQ